MPKIRKIERFSGKVEDGRTDRQTVIHKKKKISKTQSASSFALKSISRQARRKTKNSEGHNIEIHLSDIEPVES